jgi:4-amino-4-deoxy-L-arabinose transferase-like glycosyltransferase
MPDALTIPPRTQVRSDFWKALVAIVLLAIAALAALPTQDFANGGENLVVSTALETRRTGHWLIPTMDGLPRINKPPLPMWMAARGISDDVLSGVNSPDQAVRDHAYAMLSLQTRWPAVVACVLALLVCYERGVTVADGDTRIGWMGACAAGTTMYLFHNARHITTDVQIMLWVAVANLCFAKMVFGGWRWRGAIGAGAALGLALMSKGPVCLLQSVVPVIAFVAWDAWMSRRHDGWRAPRTRPGWPLVLGVILATLAVALPWYVAVLIRHWAVKNVWWMEMMQASDPDMSKNNPFAYVVFVAWLVPWVVFFICGLISVGLDMRGRSAVVTLDIDAKQRQRWVRGMVFAAMLVVVPLLVMSCFRDRKDRYALPMVIPSGIMAARGVIEYLSARRAGQKVGYVGLLHWLTVGVMTVGIAIAGGTHKLLRTDDAPWFSPGLSIGAAVAFAVALAVAVYLDQRRQRGLVLATVLVMAGWQFLFFYGYQRGPGASEMKPMADRIWQVAPNAVVKTSGPQKLPIPPDLPIYLNRPVQWAKSFDDLPPADHPWVVVVRQRHGSAVPVTPQGWTLFSTVKREPNLWHAFLRPAQSPQ